MKPLVLTVHGSHQIQDGPGNVTTVYHDTDYGRNVYDWKADQISREQKRLTDAELAAEAYRQNIRAIGECGDAGIFQDGNEYRVVPSDVITFGPMRREVWMSHTIIRFATLPHYDEAPATNDTTGTL